MRKQSNIRKKMRKRREREVEAIDKRTDIVKMKEGEKKKRRKERGMKRERDDQKRTMR